MAATKEQERKALEKIKKIVEELGEDSYIGMAFEGCFEIAEENIENDFGCSMKQRAEAAEKKLKTAEIDNRDLRNMISDLKSKYAGIESKVLTTAEAGAIKAILSSSRMKAANKAIRLKDTEAGDDLLREMGYSEEAIKKLREPDFCGRVGYPSFELTNNNANIRRVEERIKSLKAAKERGSSEQEYKTFKAVENTEAMRYQIIFDGKPEEEIRTLLKSNGFKWAPSQGAWQRQITGNGKWAFNRVIEKLKEMEG